MYLPRVLCFFRVVILSDAKTFRGAGNRNLIIGGKEAADNRHRYAVSLQDESSHFCGGSIVAPDVVLNAGK